tara:strand:- start:700 stop:930 length:231 start_codon:yes stop_codon:yes gene_type:complete
MKKVTLVQTEDHKFFRDTSSLGVINNDKAAYMQYKAQRAKGNQVQELCAEVSNLKQDMVEIKNMLITLTEGCSSGK